MNYRIVSSVLLGGGLLLTACQDASAPQSEAATEASRTVLQEVRRDIGSEAYRVEAYLRLFDQRSRLLILAGALSAEAAVDELAAAGREASNRGVDDTFMQDLIARHGVAFSQFHATLERVVTTDNGRVKLARARPGYERMIAARIDPLPLLIQLNFLWAEETGTAWPEADQFSGFAMRVRAAIPDAEIRSALAALDAERVAEARMQTQRQSFRGGPVGTLSASTSNTAENVASVSEAPLVESQPNSRIFGFGNAPSTSLQPVGNPREIDTLWRSNAGTFAFPPLQDGAIEVIAMGGNELLVGELQGQHFVGHWVQIVEYGDPVCGNEMSGSRIWGRIEIEFASDYGSFEGRSGECDSTNLDFTWTADRTQ